MKSERKWSLKGSIYECIYIVHSIHTVQTFSGSLCYSKGSEKMADRSSVQNIQNTHNNAIQSLNQLPDEDMSESGIHLSQIIT